MGKKKQGVLDGVDDPNGKLIDTTSVIISVPKKIEDIEIRKLDNGYYRTMSGESVGDGETIEAALKSLKRLLR